MGIAAQPNSPLGPTPAVVEAAIPGYFERAARRSARRAAVRNGVIGAFFLAWAVFAVTVGLAQARSPSDQDLVLALIAVELVCAGLASWRFAVARSRLRDLSRHPIFRDFAPYGEPRAVAAAIEREVSLGLAIATPSAILTGKLLVKTGFGHGVVRLEDIAWVHGKTVRHSVNFIPVGTTSSLELFTFSIRHRWTAMMLDADGTLFETLQRRAPKARFGFSLKNEEWWNSTRTALAHGDRKARGRVGAPEGG